MPGVPKIRAGRKGASEDGLARERGVHAFHSRGERATGEAGGGARGSEAHLTHPVFAISTCGERGGRRLAGA